MAVLVSLCFGVIGWGLITPVLAGIAHPTRFERLTIEQGMPSNWVRALHQDTHGFLWVGTQDGLARYDGYNFTIFRANPGDSTSLSDNAVWDLQEDQSGRLWVATSGGLNLFLPDQETFVQYQHQPHHATSLSHDVVNTLFVDRLGQLWVGTNDGLNRFDVASGQFVRFNLNEPGSDPAARNRITAITQAGPDSLWVGTGDGLLEFNPDTSRFRSFRHDPARPGSLGAREVRSLLVDRSGQLWVGTLGGGLNLYHPETSTFDVFLFSPNGEGNNVSCILEDSLGQIWITSYLRSIEGGLHRFQRATKQFESFAYDPKNPYSLSWNFGTTLLEDASGLLWIGTSRGLNKYDLRAKSFTSFLLHPENPFDLGDNYYAVELDSRGDLWLGTDSPVLHQVNLKTGDVKTFEGNGTVAGLGETTGFYSIVEDRRGMIWFGTATSGLLQYDPQKKSFRAFSHDPKNPNSISSNYVGRILEDPSGDLWVGTDRGLNRFNPQTGRFTPVAAEFAVPGATGPFSVSALWLDRQGQLWIGTGPTISTNAGGGAGLLRLNPQTGAVAAFRHDTHDPASLSSDIITSIVEDRSGTLWVGTSNGFNRFVPDQQTFVRYTEKNGLPAPYVLEILPDPGGDLWISFHFVLAKFEPTTGMFHVYDSKDGIQTRRFNIGCAFQAPDGQFYLGGVGGITRFWPDKIKDNPEIPPVRLTAFRKFDKVTRLNASLCTLQEIELKYWETVFGFEFSALNYRSPEKNQYAYQLVNFDADWVYCGNRRFVNYTNLNPGEYIFRVKGSNNDGVWNDVGQSIRIRIIPPPWRTWWAYGLYLLGFSAGLWGVVQFQTSKVKSRAHLKEVHLRAKTAESEAEVSRAKAEAAVNLARAIEAERQRQAQELEEARQLQLSMLPRTIPNLPDLAISVYMKTATEVGGDYYDFHLADDQTLSVVIGDATGHGLRAGMMVTATKSLFGTLAQEPDLPQLLSRMSQALKRLNLKTLYMALTVLRIKGNRVTLGAAGMPPALVYRAHTGQIEDIEIEGLPLGSFIQFPYQTAEFSLDPGDMVVLMSDGFPEQLNPTEEVFGYGRMREILEAAPAQSPQDVISRLIQTGEAWARGVPQADDVTFVVIQYQPVRSVRQSSSVRVETVSG